MYEIWLGNHSSDGMKNVTPGSYFSRCPPWVPQEHLGGGQKGYPEPSDPFPRGPLINTYHALYQPSGTTPGQSYAAVFIDFVASEKGQNIIATYGADLYGEGL